MQKLTEQPDQRRSKPRQRTRLRSGKVAQMNGGFLTECQIFDRSEKGARLRLAEPKELPEHIRLFDDERNTLSVAVIIWVKDRDIGVEFPPGPGNLETDGKEHAALVGRYYAIK